MYFNKFNNLKSQKKGDGFKLVKKFFTDRSLSFFINEIKSYTDNAVSKKSDKSHTHEEFEDILTEAKAYSDTKIAALVDSAPDTLDTLGELAVALEENQDVVAVLDAAITTKANISDLKETQEDVEFLKSKVLSNALIMSDSITGGLYAIQIQNGRIVSMPIEEFEVSE